MTTPTTDIAAFTPYSLEHGVAVGLVVLVTAAAIWNGRRVRDTPKEERWRRSLGIFAALVWLASAVLWSLPKYFDPAVSLPLHFCDLTGLLVPIAILTQRRSLYAILYFWGIGLSLQGFIQPTLDEAFPDPRSINFWLTHGAIVGSAIYILAVERYRPDLKGLILAVALANAYAIILVVLNIATSWNYGYVGDSNAQQATIIDVLGPWPQRVPIMMLIGSAAMVCLWLPWRFLKGVSDTGTRP